MHICMLISCMPIFNVLCRLVVASLTKTSLMPRPNSPTRKHSLVIQVNFLGLVYLGEKFKTCCDTPTQTLFRYPTQGAKFIAASKERATEHLTISLAQEI